MPRFFCENINGNVFSLAGDDAKHISKVLRFKEGDELTLSNMQGTDYKAIIEEITSDEITGKVLSSFPCENEPNLKLRLYMAIPKGDKAELIVQKAVELGAYEVIFIMTHRCVSKPDDKSFAKKLERYNKISLEAAKQSQRGIIPQIKGILSYKQTFDEIKQNDSKAILFYENSTSPLKKILEPINDDISIIIGSEGGFEQEEVDFALLQNAQIASLGKRILRCETAPLAAISAIMFDKNNF